MSEKLIQFEAERDELLAGAGRYDVYRSDSFRCEQTDGVLAILTTVLTKDKAWLEPASEVNNDLTPEQLYKLRLQCADFGIRECCGADDFNKILEELGEEAEIYGHMETEEEEEESRRLNARWKCDDDCDNWWEEYDDDDYYYRDYEDYDEDEYDDDEEE